MAETSKKTKETTVEERLKTLYKLQTYLSEIDRIKTLRGELPNEVKDREDEIERFRTRIEKHEDELRDLNDYVGKRRAAIEESRAKVARYNQQMEEVSNNREYTFLEKEKEYQTLEIELAEKNIRDAGIKIENKEAELARDREDLSDNEHILEQKKVELAEIISETKAEEEALRVKAKDLEEKFDDKYTLTAFKRIRRNARNGLGIVPVQRDACGGCFNRIPAQRQLEIQMHKKVIVCEYCGRIMIDPLLAGIQPIEAPAPKKSTRSRSKKA